MEIFAELSGKNFAKLPFALVRGILGTTSVLTETQMQQIALNSLHENFHQPTGKLTLWQQVLQNKHFNHLQQEQVPMEFVVCFHVHCQS
jgi:hypothetical protein